MKRAGWFTCPAVTLAVIGFSLPQLAAADLPRRPPVVDPLPVPAAPAVATVADVALADGGVLWGQVVDPQGSPQSNQLVAVRQQERIIATARTDQGGRFSIGGLPGGVYQIVAADGAGVYRLWAPIRRPGGSAGRNVGGGQTIGARTSSRWRSAILVDESLGAGRLVGCSDCSADSTGQSRQDQHQLIRVRNQIANRCSAHCTAIQASLAGRITEPTSLRSLGYAASHVDAGLVFSVKQVFDTIPLPSSTDTFASIRATNRFFQM